MTKCPSLLLAVLAVALLSSCAHQPMPMAYDPPGFFSGLLHGVVMPFAFVGSIVSDVRIYAFPNSGVWYDFAFLLGLFPWVAAGRS